MAPTNQLGERLAVVEQQVHAILEEVKLARKRLHDLESDRATLTVVAEQLRQLSGTVHEIAQDAAERAVEASFEKRREVHRLTWSLRVQYLVAGVMLGSLMVALATLFAR